MFVVFKFGFHLLSMVIDVSYDYHDGDDHHLIAYSSLRTVIQRDKLVICLLSKYLAPNTSEGLCYVHKSLTTASNKNKIPILKLCLCLFQFKEV